MVTPVGKAQPPNDQNWGIESLVQCLLMPAYDHNAEIDEVRELPRAHVAVMKHGGGFEVALALKDLGHFADALDEDEGAHLAERVVQGVHHGEEEDGGGQGENAKLHIYDIEGFNETDYDNLCQQLEKLFNPLSMRLE